MFSIPNLAPILPFNKANPDLQKPVWDPCPFNAFSSVPSPKPEGYEDKDHLLITNTSNLIPLTFNLLSIDTLEQV